MWKNTVEPGRPQTTQRRMRIACWIPRLQRHAQNKHAILTAFPMQQWLHECTLMLRYTYITCLVSNKKVPELQGPTFHGKTASQRNGERSTKMDFKHKKYVFDSSSTYSVFQDDKELLRKLLDQRGDYQPFKQDYTRRN